MDRSIPIFNRVVMQKMQKNQFDMHQKRLEKIKSTLPKKKILNSIKITNPKGQQLQEQKRTEVEKKNVILFNKMDKIMNRSQNRLNSTGHTHFKGIQQKQNERIYQQNKFIVQRIGNQKPTINSKKLFQDRIKQQKILKLMGRYPYRVASTGQGMRTIDNMSYQQDEGNDQEEYYNNNQPNSMQNLQRQVKQKPYLIHDKKNNNREYYQNVPLEKNEDLIKNSNNRQLNKSIEREHKQVIPLFKKRKQIVDGIFQVEINRLYNQYEFKLVDLKTLKTYSLYLNEVQGNSILSRYDYDYNFITSCFKIKNHNLRLQLDNGDDVAPYPQKKSEKRQHYQQFSLKQDHGLFNQGKLINHRLKEQQSKQRNQRQSDGKNTDFPQKPSFVSQNNYYSKEEQQQPKYPIKNLHKNREIHQEQSSNLVSNPQFITKQSKNNQKKPQIIQNMKILYEEALDQSLQDL